MMPPLWSVADAQNLIRQRVSVLPARLCSTVPGLLGQVLRCEVTADQDSPPFPKALMDGYAIRSHDFRDDHTTFKVVGELRAGHASELPALRSQETVRIFTGAPLPDQADAVVKQEEARVIDEQHIKFARASVSPWLNAMRRGEEMQAGVIVIAKGTVLTPLHLSLAAAVGQTKLLVTPRLSVAILATGDELVPPSQTPSPGQIRNSNGLLLHSLIHQFDCDVTDYGITRDSPEALTDAFTQALDQHDLLIVTGGVSVGKYDYTPGVLEQLGVSIEIHKVRLKPGKPMLFGMKGTKPVFGLPGNPVSAFACFTLFVQIALECLQGNMNQYYQDSLIQAKLDIEFLAKNDRPTYWPTKLSKSNDAWLARPNPRLSSANLRELLDTHGFLVLPEGEFQAQPGEYVPVMPYPFSKIHH